MKDSRPNLPLPYRFANALSRPLVAARLPITRLDEGSVCAAAMKKTGLTDFGDPHYRQGLSRLLESAAKDANLHPLGRYTANAMVTTYLIQRLRLVETRRKEPEIFQGPLRPPLIITGLERSGTTFLHRMVALDPAHRALPLWLLMRPFPDRHMDGAGPDHRLAQMEWAVRVRLPLLPGIDTMHYTRADTPEECIVALGLTFNSLIFCSLLPVSGYFDWYLRQKDTWQKYREYRWLLQVFQSQDPGGRLTLKAPAHAGNLEALFQAVPEALVIQTHRDPVACVSSVFSLINTFYLAVANEIDMPRMTSLALHAFELWLGRNLAFRAAHPGLVYDVFYDALVSDPAGTVQGIYSRFGLPWTDAYASDLQEFIQRNPKDKHGKHRYSASDFGVTEADIIERLGFYSAHFGLRQSNWN